MKTQLSLVSLFILLLAACSPSGKETKGKIADQVVLKPFSDTARVDTFKVSLTGEVLEDMNISFTITAHRGQQIYHKAFKATDLIGNYKYTVDLKKERNQMAFIKEEFKLFFEEENFLEPAVTENENPDKNVPDVGFYNELKKSGLNGFKYRSGKETSVYIAWSESAQKVKIYYNCCK